MTLINLELPKIKNGFVNGHGRIHLGQITNQNPARSGFIWFDRKLNYSYQTFIRVLTIPELKSDLTFSN